MKTEKTRPTTRCELTIRERYLAKLCGIDREVQDSFTGEKRRRKPGEIRHVLNLAQNRGLVKRLREMAKEFDEKTGDEEQTDALLLKFTEVYVGTLSDVVVILAERKVDRCRDEQEMLSQMLGEEIAIDETGEGVVLHIVRYDV